eukprot:gene11054-biopygen2636
MRSTMGIKTLKCCVGCHAEWHHTQQWSSNEAAMETAISVATEAAYTKSEVDACRVCSLVHRQSVGQPSTADGGLSGDGSDWRPIINAWQ